MSELDSDPRDVADDATARLRKPPHNLAAEQSVLGAVLIDNSAWDKVSDLLTEASFYRAEHRAIFAAIGRLVNSLKEADPVTVLAELHRVAKAGDAPALEYLEALCVSVPSASNARRYAEIVAERALERQLVAAGDEIASLGFAGDGGSAAQRLDRAVTRLLQLEASGVKAQTSSPLSDLVVRLVDRVNELHEQGDEASPAWKTPLAPLNRVLLGGLRPGKVYVLAARPSIGKTAFAQMLSVHAAFAEALPVLFLSQEMSRDDIAMRIVSQLGGVDHGHLQTGQINDHEWGGLSYGAEVAGRLDFDVDEEPGLTIGQIRAKARAKRGVKLIVVDYLQLTSAPASNRPSNRNAEIGEVSRGIKNLAKELGAAVILLSQLNREVDKRPGQKPIMGDLRDSGEIEQDADVIIFLWPLKPGQPAGTDGCVPIGVRIEKNRGGQRYVEFPTLFNARLMRWGESELPMTAYTKSEAAKGPDL